MWPQIRHMYFFIGRESDWSKLSFYQVHPGDVAGRMLLGCSSDTALEARAAMSSPTDQDPDFPPLVMTFAASDPSGGAGIQADILTLASMGCHPLSVLTAITVQHTRGVEAVSEILSGYPDVPLVLDPVLASGRGDELANDEMLHAMRELLLPQTTILTPNSLEARRLADTDDEDEPLLSVCAQRLIEIGCEFVLITGTHEPTLQVVNTLYGKNGVVRTDTWQRLPGTYHGSGCTLASAIAAMLANGLELPEAVREAQDYTWHALQKAYRPGMGQFLPDRLFWARDGEASAEPDVDAGEAT